MVDAANSAPVLEVVVEGEYYSGTKNNKISRQYSGEVFILPENCPNVLQRIQRQLLDERLKKKYDDYSSWRTCQIISSRVVRAGASVAKVRDLLDTPIEEMTIEQLSQFCVMQSLPVEPARAGSITDARRKVKDAFEDKKLVAKREKEDKAEEEKEAETLRRAKNEDDDGYVDGPPTASVDPNDVRNKPLPTDPLAGLDD